MSIANPKKSATRASAVKIAPRARRRGRLWWALRVAVLLLGAPVVMAAITAVMLIGREVTAPSWIVRDVEARAALVLGGGALGFGQLRVTVGRDLHPRLVLVNAVLRDRTGGVVARVPRIEGQISPRGVLQGRVLAQHIRLSGAQISLRRARNGTVALAFDQGAVAIGAADGFIGLLEQIDQVFAQGALEALEEVTADGLIINYTDARAGRSWVVDDGRIGLDVRDGMLALRAEVALLSGRAFVTTAELTYRSPRGARTAEIGLSINDAAAADIASQSPLLAFLSVLDAPISGSVRGRIDEDGQLQDTSATLNIGAGEVRPSPQTRPIPFQSARTYLTFDAQADRLRFDLIEIDSDWGRASGTAQTYLRDYRNGWPEVLLGQIQLNTLQLAPEGLLDTPIDVTQGSLDFRLRLDPFTLDIGQAVARNAGTPLALSGQIRAATNGWSVALDARAETIAAAQVIALWPAAVAPRTRQWIADNITAGTLQNAHLAYRGHPDVAPNFALSLDFSDAQVRFMPTLPPIDAARGTVSIVDRRVALTLDAGHVTAPTGGLIEMAGSTMIIPRTGVPGAPVRFDLALQSGLGAALSLLALEPFNGFTGSTLGPDFADGRAQIDAVIETPLGPGTTPDQRVWSARAVVRDVRSDVLVAGQTLTAPELSVAVDGSGLRVEGPARLGNVGGSVVYTRDLGAGTQDSGRLQAQLRLGPALLEAFNVTLPPGMITGEGDAQLALDLGDPGAPAFRLTSDLRGVGLTLAAVGWSKDRAAAGAFTVAGQLGPTPRIDAVSLSAPGLQTSGTVRLAPGGGLERAIFPNVRLGGWLDAPVVLVGRGPGRPVAVEIGGGTLDLRAANFAASGQGGPIDIALERLQITDRIELSDFRGDFSAETGFQGTFSGNVNGTAPVRGTVVPAQGRSAVRITTQDAGSLLRATGLLRTAVGGDMELTLVPAGATGTYDGTLTGSDLRVRDAPLLASLLDAVSIVGLFTQMDGQGLLFTTLDAQFRLTPERVIVTQSSAVGPSLGLSLDGIYDLTRRALDFQGVVSPIYLLNGIGAVLTRPGEGLFGFNFNISGAVDTPQVSVNPLSALTPGMFRDIFRRPPPTVTQ